MMYIHERDGAFMMPEQLLSDDERSFLLKLARNSLEKSVNGLALPPLDLNTLSPLLREPGASFVTLTYKGNLRGCIGALEPYQSLAEDVREHAVAAALQDYRFPPVRPNEVADIEIEISRLTPPKKLKYGTPKELPERLRPHIDGVVLRDVGRRATFLPQVWEKITDPEEFLENLCLKMGAQPDLWRWKKLDVLTYQVEEFHEKKIGV
jgi:AmmeMemoRadiSam system protein A